MGSRLLNSVSNGAVLNFYYLCLLKHFLKSVFCLQNYLVPCIAHNDELHSPQYGRAYISQRFGLSQSAELES